MALVSCILRLLLAVDAKRAGQLGGCPVHILTDIAMKHDKTKGLTVRSSEVRWGNVRAPGASQNAKIENGSHTPGDAGPRRI